MAKVKQPVVQQVEIQTAYPPPQRVHFTEHDQRLHWLSLLMDAYLITVQSISEAISREEKQGKN